MRKQNDAAKGTDISLKFAVTEAEQTGEVPNSADGKKLNLNAMNADGTVLFRTLIRLTWCPNILYVLEFEIWNENELHSYAVTSDLQDRL